MNTKKPASRILVAVDALDRSADALEAVTRLAAGRFVELAGLFVEDADLLRLAGWPAATETRLFERSAQPIGAAELEAALRAQAAAMQRRLDVLAREIGLPWSFRTVRGHVVQQALSLAGSEDSIVLAGATTCIQLRLRTASLRPVIWLLAGDPQELALLLEAAARFDPRAVVERRVVLPEDPAGAAALRAAPAVKAAGLRTASAAELMSRAAGGPRIPGELLLMTRAAGASDPERLRRLLRRSVAPLVLV